MVPKTLEFEDSFRILCPQRHSVLLEVLKDSARVLVKGIYMSE